MKENDKNTADTKTFNQKAIEWRCDCGKLLFKGVLLIGVIEVKCTRCKRIVYLQECESFTTSEPSFMLILSIGGEILSLSDGITDILGHSSEECIGENIQQYVTRNTRVILGFWLKKLSNLAATNNPHLFFPLKIRHRNGSWVAFTVFVKCIGYQDNQFTFAVAEQGGDALRRYETRLKKDKGSVKYKQYDVWDFAIDIRGRIVDCSPSNTLGVAPQDAKGKTVFELFGIQPDFSEHDITTRLRAGENLLRKIDITSDTKVSTVYNVSITADILTDPVDQCYIVSLSLAAK